ncbi:hypothetical protein L6452_34076 [Arctium lappa]|uniref:Uncharacterized protein n=1 Tax=Arctium lappa TaxID=4217 RepID=A0ACB8YIS5_ARCLA|nr:hypothetical protein L6452_34076 [Arctium lappa]
MWRTKMRRNSKQKKWRYNFLCTRSEQLYYLASVSISEAQLQPHLHLTSRRKHKQSGIQVSLFGQNNHTIVFK